MTQSPTVNSAPLVISGMGGETFRTVTRSLSPDSTKLLNEVKISFARCSTSENSRF